MITLHVWKNSKRNNHEGSVARVETDEILFECATNEKYRLYAIMKLYLRSSDKTIATRARLRPIVNTPLVSGSRPGSPVRSPSGIRAPRTDRENGVGRGCASDDAAVIALSRQGGSSQFA